MRKLLLYLLWFFLFIFFLIIWCISYFFWWADYILLIRNIEINNNSNKEVIIDIIKNDWDIKKESLKPWDNLSIKLDEREQNIITDFVINSKYSYKNYFKEKLIIKAWYTWFLENADNFEIYFQWRNFDWIYPKWYFPFYYNEIWKIINHKIEIFEELETDEQSI
jgi:hypothetical protein